MVNSEIANKYAALGGSAGFLGAPISPENPTPDGVGRFQHYQFGSIYWSPQTRAHEVHGSIRDRWTALGWEKSSLGYPVSDETATSDGTARVSQFQHGAIYWIGEPNVRQRMTEYFGIRFLPGDRITVEAGGGVQTGGSGKTWKRYVDPVGPLTAHLYHGLLWIPGATLPLQRIRYCNGRIFEVPLDVYRAQNLYLRLGYEDDNYTDNGYYSHDDGVGDQCKGIGSAFMRLTVQHRVPERPVPPLVSSAPLDVVWDNVDVNGLPLNPKWGAQVTNPGQTGFDPPDVVAISPLLADGYVDPIVQAIYELEPNVTTQAPSYNWGIGLKSAFCHGGHANWGAVTYEGRIHFKDHDGGLTGDDDYNFLLYPLIEHWGLVKGNVVTTDIRRGLLLEFDSDETIDDFESPWWKAFHQAVDGDERAARQMVDGRYAIATGLMGLDAGHDGDPWTEVHPVWALTIRVNDDPADETWAIFVRNWGNEGGCGNHHQNYLDLPGNQYMVRLPWRPGAAGVTAQCTPNDFHLRGSGTAGPDVTSVPGQGVFVTFTLPRPDDQALINGALHLRWEGVTPHTARSVRAFLNAHGISPAQGLRSLHVQSVRALLAGG